MFHLSKYLLLFCLAVFSGTIAHAQIYYAGTQPGKAVLEKGKDGWVLKNDVLRFAMHYGPGKILDCRFTDILTHDSIMEDGSAYFRVFLKRGTILNSGDFNMETVPVNPSGKKAQAFTLLFSNIPHRIQVKCTISLADSDNYVRQYWQVVSAEEPMEKIETTQLAASIAPHSAGTVDGSPVVVRNMFFAIEHPMFKVDSSEGNFGLGLKAPYDSVENLRFSLSSVMGVTPDKQLRQGFLYYLEKIRARKYRPFLHYNSWFDLSYNADTLKAEDCMDRVHTWIDSLTVKRKLSLDAFLWDSGWDDFDRLWHFNQYLPHGFSEMAAFARKYHTSMGVWLSPWGGYDDAVRLRMKGAGAHHPELERNENGFTLSGAHYYNYFKKAATRFLEKENVRIFKFDGVGAGLGASGPGDKYQKDIEAFLRIITDLRKTQPATYFSLTVGTWPSPYWLKYGDNIWRGGGDMGFEGEGNRRQRWLTFRDYDGYRNIVQRAPLYPLNALMDHGITIGNKGLPASLENDLPDLSDDFWAFFGNGTSLQELYVNPHKLDAAAWDELARVIRWARAHQGILADTHWIGGNPAQGEVYGYGSWNLSGGLLMLRNPSSQPVEYVFELDRLLEIPASRSGKYRLVDARKETPFATLLSSGKNTLLLKPFEVKVLDVLPLKK